MTWNVLLRGFAATICPMMLLSSGCSKSESGNAASSTATPSAASQPANTSGAEKKIVIGMSQANLGEPFRVQMNADIKAAAEKQPNVTVIFKDAQNDTLKQRSQVEEFVSQKVDALIISPKEAQPLTQPVANAMDAGIPVIVLDRRVLGDKYTTFIGGDNKKIGHAAGDWVVKALGGKGNIVELEGLMTSTPAQERHAGFAEAIAGSDIKTVFQADMKWLEPDARSEAESAFARSNDIQLVFAHNDPGAHGAYLAAQAAGRKAIKFIGIDGLPQEGMAYVRQGILDATFQYPTGGAEAIDAVMKISKGQSVSKQITLSSRYYTKDNVANGGELLP